MKTIAFFLLLAGALVIICFTVVCSVAMICNTVEKVSAPDPHPHFRMFLIPGSDEAPERPDT